MVVVEGGVIPSGPWERRVIRVKWASVSEIPCKTPSCPAVVGICRLGDTSAPHTHSSLKITGTNHNLSLSLSLSHIHVLENVLHIKKLIIVY